MKVNDIIEVIQGRVIFDTDSLELEVTGAYCSDLLSDVMANAVQGNLWITLQTHPNIVAVASLVGLSGIIISRGLTPDPETIEKAKSENIPIIKTDLPTFEAAGKLYLHLGLK